MKVLFIHQNFPGQYLHLARHLGANPANEVVFITQRTDAELTGVRKVLYKPQRPVTPQNHHYLRETEAGILNGQQIARGPRAAIERLHTRSRGRTQRLG